MKIKFLGASGTVTGSSYVLTSDSGTSILIDLGMFQGVYEIDKLNYLDYDYDVSRLSGAVLTHAHLDHCGRLPILIPKGFVGDIWMTEPTRDLTEISLLDSAKIAKYDKNKSLYDEDIVYKTVEKFRTTEYGKQFEVGDFLVTMRDAGHMLGSTSLEIVDTKSKSEIKKIVFSGDLGNTPEELVRETETINDTDVVVMESTYGGRLHPSENPVDVIADEINIVQKTGGTLLIPAFSLERTQELLHMIKHLIQEKKISSNTPIFMDGPMAKKATAVYLKYPDLFNAHIQTEMRDESPFSFESLEEEMRDVSGVKVIIAGSGMMMGGKIMDHARRYLPGSDNRILIVGYQGEGTVGRQILDGEKTVLIYGEKVAVRANVNSTQAMSSHADSGQLVSWLRAIKGVKKVFLTHGENESRTALTGEIKRKIGIEDVEMPVLNQEVSILS